MSRRKTIYKVVTIITIAATLLCAAYIMANCLGLSDKLDFGAGAYYYADIPEFKKYLADEAYHSSIPYWVYVLLFLCWGWLMYRLWCWIDKH